jgi:hypothetical protein
LDDEIEDERRGHFDDADGDSGMAEGVALLGAI